MSLSNLKSKVITLVDDGGVPAVYNIDEIATSGPLSAVLYLITLADGVTTVNITQDIYSLANSLENKNFVLVQLVSDNSALCVNLNFVSAFVRNGANWDMYLNHTLGTPISIRNPLPQANDETSQVNTLCEVINKSTKAKDYINANGVMLASGSFAAGFTYVDRVDNSFGPYVESFLDLAGGVQ